SEDGRRCKRQHSTTGMQGLKQAASEPVPQSVGRSIRSRHFIHQLQRSIAQPRRNGVKRRGASYLTEEAHLVVDHLPARGAPVQMRLKVGQLRPAKLVVNIKPDPGPDVVAIAHYLLALIDSTRVRVFQPS